MTHLIINHVFNAVCIAIVRLQLWMLTSFQFCLPAEPYMLLFSNPLLDSACRLFRWIRVLVYYLDQPHTVRSESVLRVQQAGVGGKVVDGEFSNLLAV